MFLDIKSSTTIAEKLGHNSYFKLLNDFFADITDSILYNKGEIYQYVGDEVVVSWKVKNGIRIIIVSIAFLKPKGNREATSKYLKSIPLFLNLKQVCILEWLQLVKLVF